VGTGSAYEPAELAARRSGDPTQVGTLRTAATAYPEPIDALLNGEPVQLIAFGDIVGMSPAEKFIQRGKIDWASSEDFVVLPQSTEERHKVYQQLVQQRNQ
jgi:hypothetical protein